MPRVRYRLSYDFDLRETSKGNCKPSLGPWPMSGSAPYTCMYCTGMFPRPNIHVMHWGEFLVN